MTMFPWKPLQVSFDLEKRIDEVFSQLIEEPWGRSDLSRSWQPEIDVYETDDAYLIEADLPGVHPKNVEIHVEENGVSIAGTRSSSTRMQSARVLMLQRRQGRFSRRISLNTPVDPQRVESRYEEGIYHLRVPKKKRKQ